MTRYRVLLSGRPVSRWCATRDAAEDAAIKKGLASRDEHSRTLYLHPMAAIDTDEPLPARVADWLR